MRYIGMHVYSEYRSDCGFVLLAQRTMLAH